MAEKTLAPDVRSVTIPIAGTRVLLPNACVSEVITYGTLQPLDQAPDWVLGALNWRGWRLPIFSFGRLAGVVEEEPTSGAKIAILKAFSGVHTMPYMGLLAQGFPRLTAVTADDLKVTSSPGSEGPILHAVTIDGDEALIPSFDEIEEVLLPLMKQKSVDSISS